MPYNYIRQLAHASNYGGARSRDNISFIALHYTANDGDKAASNAKYFQEPGRNASAHYFVDSNNVYQSVSDLYVAWSVGGKKYADCLKTGGGSLYNICTNSNSISIELCDDLKDGKIKATEGTIANAIELCVNLMLKYNIPPERVIRHFDVTGKICPAYFVEDPAAWLAFKKRLSDAYKSSVQSSKTAQTTNTTAAENKAPVKRFYVVTAKDGLNIRENAGTGYKKIGALAKGDRLEFISQQGDWIRGKDSAGRIGYAYSKWLKLEP